MFPPERPLMPPASTTGVRFAGREFAVGPRVRVRRAGLVVMRAPPARKSCGAVEPRGVTTRALHTALAFRRSRSGASRGAGGSRLTARLPSPRRHESASRTHRLEIEDRNLALSSTRLPTIELVVELVIHDGDEPREEVHAVARLISGYMLGSQVRAFILARTARPVRDRVTTVRPVLESGLALDAGPVYTAPPVVDIAPEVAHSEPLRFLCDHDGLLICLLIRVRAKHPHNLTPRFAVLQCARELLAFEAVVADLKDGRQDAAEGLLVQRVE